MRIIAGAWRSRQLVAPAGLATRPMPDRVREAVFDILGSYYGSPGTLPSIRVADLFAGLGAYSYAAYETYEAWHDSQAGQSRLPGLENGTQHDTPPKFTNRERERCTGIHHLNKTCKRHKMKVGLKSSRGFKTYDPRRPINFWPYEPQHPDDKAPLRGE